MSRHIFEWQCVRLIQAACICFAFVAQESVASDFIEESSIRGVPPAVLALDAPSTETMKLLSVGREAIPYHIAAMARIMRHQIRPEYLPEDLESHMIGLKGFFEGRTDCVCCRYQMEGYDLHFIYYGWGLRILIKQPDEPAVVSGDKCDAWAQDFLEKLLTEGSRVSSLSRKVKEEGQGVWIEYRPKDADGHYWWSTLRLWTNARYTAVWTSEGEGGAILGRMRRDDWFERDASYQDSLEKMQSTRPTAASQPTIGQGDIIAWEMNALDEFREKVAHPEQYALEGIEDAIDYAGSKHLWAEKIKLCEAGMAIATSPDNIAKIGYILGETQEFLSQKEDSKLSYTASFNQPVDNEWTLKSGARLAAISAFEISPNQEPDYVLAKVYCQRVIKRFGTKYYDSLCCHMLLGNIYLREGNVTDARRMFQAIAEAPDDEIQIIRDPLDASDPAAIDSSESSQRDAIKRVKERALRKLDQVNSL